MTKNYLIVNTLIKMRIRYNTYNNIGGTERTG